MSGKYCIYFMYFYVWTCYTAKQGLVAPLSHFVVKTIPSLPAKVKTDVNIRQLKEENLLLHLSKALCEACYHNFGTNILAQVIWDLRWLHGQKYILTTCGMANIGRLQHTDCNVCAPLCFRMLMLKDAEGINNRHCTFYRLPHTLQATVGSPFYLCTVSMSSKKWA